MPKEVHPAIQWSKHDPLVIHDADSYDLSQLRLLQNTAMAAKSKREAGCQNIEVTSNSTTSESPNALVTLPLGVNFAPQGTKHKQSDSITNDKMVSTLPRLSTGRAREPWT